MENREKQIIKCSRLNRLPAMDPSSIDG